VTAGGPRDWLAELQAELAGRYTVELEVARGAMARVYRARRLATDQTVAIKVLPPELASDANGERFLREIRITSQLQHPNILPLLDSGVAGTHYWYAMPLVEGESLRTRLKNEGPFPPGPALEVADQIGAALAHAHASGVVHRDLKPENVMRLEGRWVVLDFGLAKALESDGRLTGVNMPLGTPPYMSPEQITGAAGVDARADIYGFGCILYELVTGRPPFVGASVVHFLRAHLQEIPVPPSQVRAGVPRSFDRAILKALEKKPDARYQSAVDLIADLRGSAGPEPPTERPRGEGGLLSRWFKKGG
jgi:serine/threonine-protein kinase